MMSLLTENQLETYIKGICDLPNPAIFRCTFSQDEVVFLKRLSGTHSLAESDQLISAVCNKSKQNLNFISEYEEYPTFICLRLSEKQFYLIIDIVQKTFSANQVNALKELCVSYGNFLNLSRDFENLYDFTEALTRLDEITNQEDRSLNSTLRQYLNLATAYLKLEVGSVSFVENNLIKLRAFWPDSAFDQKATPKRLKHSFEELILKADEPIMVSNMAESNLNQQVAFKDARLQSFAGVSLQSIKHTAVLSFYANSIIREAFTQYETKFISLLAQRVRILLDKEYRKRKLREERELLISFVKTAPAAIAMFDRELRYITASNKWIKDYRIDRDISGISHYEVFPEISDEWKAIHQAALQGEIFKNDSEEFKRADGSSQHLRWEVAPWYTNTHKVGGLLMYTEDITELVEQKNKIQEANAALLESSKIKEQFAYIASHDLQQPVRTIASMAKTVKMKFGNELPSHAQTMINFIEEGAERMNRLIRGLLDYSQLGKDPLIKKVNINTLIEEIKIDLSEAIKEKKATISSSEYLPILKGYETELRLLFYNLINNAIKFSREGVAPKISIRCIEEKSFYTFSIRDNGIGIQQDYRDKIFQIFQRLHDKTKYQGEGIGLAHVKRVVELHKGTIEVKENKPHGSKFIFTISKRL